MLKLIQELTVKHNRHISNIILSKAFDIRHYCHLGLEDETPIQDILKHYQDQPENWDIYSTSGKTFEILHLHLPHDHRLLIIMHSRLDFDLDHRLQELISTISKEDILSNALDTLKRILRNFIFDKYLLDLFLQDQFFLIDTHQNFYIHTSAFQENETTNVAQIKDFFSIPTDHPPHFSREVTIAYKKFKIESFTLVTIVDLEDTYYVTGYKIIPLTQKEDSIFENYRFLNQISIPIAIFDQKSHIQFKNKSWVNFFQEHEITSFVHSINERCFSEKKNIYDESTIKGRFIKWYFDPLMISKAQYTLVSAIDSTHNKKEKIETLKTMERLKQSNQDLERFAHICGHDLKEPLRTISSFAQILKTSIHSLDQTSQNYLDLIIKNTFYMKNLIEDLLRYSECEFRSQDLKNISTPEMLQDVLSILSSKIREKRAIIKIQDSLPETIFCNKTQIIQVFQNIIDNGLKFNNKKVPIIHIGYIPNDHVDRFFIKDNGMGIHKDYIQELFTMFKRLHSKNDFQGSGIGLAMCKKIIENHKGKIWIESELSKGTSIYFEIPKNIRGEYQCAV